MTISSASAKSRYAGDGATGDFPTGFRFLDNSHVQVLLRDAGGGETLWTEGTEYSLSGAGLPGGGTVTVATSPADHRPVAGETLVIRLAIPPLQETALPLGGVFPSTAVEAMADLAALRDQEIQEALSRSLKFKVSTALAEVTFPEPEAGKIARWNAAGDALENAELPAFLDGSGAPAAALGSPGDRYLDKISGDHWKKSAAGWSLTGNIAGPPGDAGAEGAAGPAGPAGSDGADGADGSDGRTVLSGSGAPGAGLGGEGDFYIDVAALQIYGPKTAGAWGAGTGLVGPQGAPGADGSDGADGADGQGVAAGGGAGQVLAKASGADYDTAWTAPGLAKLAGAPAPQLGDAIAAQAYEAQNVTLKLAAEKNASFTFAAAEAGVLTPCNAAAAMTATVPPEASVAFAPGTTLAIWNQGAGQVTWVAGSGVTLQRDAALTLVSNGQHAVSFAIKVAGDSWVVAGGLAAA